MVGAITEIDAVESLKRLIKRAAIDGFTYAEIAKQSDTRAYWNQNSIKQFVNRTAASRKNEKTIALAKVIYKHFDSNRDLYGDNSSIISDIIKLKENILDRDYRILFSSIDRAFDSINNSASIVKLPDHFIFCRYSTNMDYVVLIRVDLYKSTHGIAFTMKISGRNNQRRIVIGNVSNTISNTYLTGVAYNVASRVNDKNLLEFDFSDPENNNILFSSNPIGQELIAIPNTSLFKTEFPVCFCGLDGRGTPINGVGAMINENALSYYDISLNNISIVKCLDHSKPIDIYMRKISANTNALSLYD